MTPIFDRTDRRNTSLRTIRRIGSLLALLGFAPSHAAYADQAFECLIQPYALIKLGSPVQGVISTVSVQRGSTVNKGQVLATLDARVENSSLRLAEARAKFASRRVYRNRELASEELVSNQDVDNMRTESELADLEHKRAKVLLEMRSIKSPINGVVVERIKSPGEYIENTELLVLAQLDPLIVEAVLPINVHGTITANSAAIVVAEPPIEATFATTVSSVDKVVDAASATYRVRMELPNPDLTIPSGVRCSVRFDP